MKLPRRRFVHLAAGAAVLPALPRVASALDYPTRPVHIIVGFAPGGVADITARLIAQWLSERFGQPFVVDNRPGNGSNLAAEIVARAPSDGYTLLQATSSNAWNAILYNNLTFDFVRDIVPIASISRGGGVMEVNPSFPAKTIPEFIAHAKSHPGKINVASSGPGTAPHLYSELFSKMAGVDFIQVHYRSSGPALADLLGGQVQVTFDPVASSIGFIKAGKLQPLGVTTAERVAALPDVPPIGNFVPGYEASGWQAIGGPRNTPTAIMEILNREVNAALVDLKFKASVYDLGYQPFASSPAELAEFIGEFKEKWAKVIRTANIKAE
jgi:tripartite-type tricarboxylate transporter receptor subunit TctC